MEAAPGGGQRRRRHRQPPTPPRSRNNLALLPLVLLLLLPLGLPPAAAATPSSPPPPSPPLVRVFVDEGLFLEGETEVLRAHAAASGGRVAVTGESTGAFLSVKGYYAPDTWDLYVTVGSACRMAWPFMRAAQLGGGGNATGGAAAKAEEEEEEAGEGGGGGSTTASSSSSVASSSYLPHQWVSCVPGSFALTAKRAMVETLQEAYGELAFTGLPAEEGGGGSQATAALLPPSSSPATAPITPRAYSLPGQYWAWRSYVRAAHLPPDTTWVLKREVHRGKGVSLLPQLEAARRARPEAAAAAAAAAAENNSGDNGGNGTPVLVQSFLRDQLLVGGRRSYLRVWMAVTSVSPVRAYLFDGGFAIFSSSVAAAAAEEKQKGVGRVGRGGGGKKGAAGKAATKGEDDGGVVNLWNQDRTKSLIWELKDLQQWVDRRRRRDGGGEGVVGGRGERRRRRHQSRRRLSGGGKHHAQPQATASSSNKKRRQWSDAWRDMRASAGLAAMAAAPYMRQDARNGSAPPRGTFEYFGLDFVLDAELRPWLLEVNAVPSMARRRRSSGCLGGSGGGGGRGGGGGNKGGGKKEKGGADCALEGEDGDGFDAQKERFVHDVLSMIGMPLDGGGEEDEKKRSSGGAAEASAPLAGPRLSAEAAALRCAAADAHEVLEERRERRRRRWRRRSLAAGDEQQQPEDERPTPMPPPPPPPPCDAPALAALDAAAAASSGAPPRARRIARRDLLPLLCDGDDDSAKTRTSVSDGGGWCARCLTPLDLSALAEAEAEASRRGALVPVHDALAARRLNRAAVLLRWASGYDDDNHRGGGPAAAEEEGEVSSSASLASLARAALPAAIRDAPPPPKPGAPAAPFLSRARAWLLAWLLPEMGAPQLLGARPRVDGAVRALELTREDYLLAAWQRTVREGPGGGAGGGSEGEEEGGGAHNHPRARLRRLASQCFSA
jgi:hypothetical protein